MKLFSYAFVYAFVVFVLYCVIRFLRFVIFRVKAYATRRKLAKLSETEKNDD